MLAVTEIDYEPFLRAEHTLLVRDPCELRIDLDSLPRAAFW
jgi:hypothetical protein